MPFTKTEIRPGAYYDSVVLMHLQRALANLDGVEDAGVIMATPANCELLELRCNASENKSAGPLLCEGAHGCARWV